MPNPLIMALPLIGMIVLIAIGMPVAFAMGVSGAAGMVRAMEGVPSNHSPLYAPVIDPTLGNGVAALVAAAKEWLGTPD